jgi:hypothetical protein
MYGGAYRILLGRCKGRTTLGRHRCRWDNKRKLNIQDVTGGGEPELEWAGSGQAVGSCECGNKLWFHKMRGIAMTGWGPVKFLTLCGPVIFFSKFFTDH